MKYIKNIFGKIKEYFQTRKNLTESLSTLGNKCVKLSNDNILLRKKYDDIFRMSTAQIVMSKILKRGVDWFDYDELPQDKKLIYYNEIQSVLRNKSYENEIKHLLADLIEFIAKETPNHDATMNVRTSVCNIEALADRLNNISDPRQKEQTPDEVVQEYHNK